MKKLFLFLTSAVLVFAPAFVLAQGSTAISVTECREIVAPGNYVLQNNLESLPGKTCINIHDTENVNLDCAKHSIGHMPDKSGSNETALKVSKVNGFSIKTCELKTVKPHPFLLFTGFPITDSNGGIIENNIIGNNFPIIVKRSSSLKFVNNKISSFYEQEKSSDNVISDNEITFISPGGKDNQASGMVSLYGGSRNSVLRNKIDGGWNRFNWTKKNSVVDLSQMSDGNPDKIGADDGIVITDEANDIVDNNQIANNFDCGIETLGTITETSITNNRISYSPICAIGAWYDSRWRNNTVANNTAESVSLLFLFEFLEGFSSTRKDGAPVYFENNIFSGNKLVSQTYSTFGKQSARFNFFHQTRDSKNIFRNNIFTNNDLKSDLASPFFYPKGLAVDGGNNICGAPTIFESYSDIYSYPLKCSGAQYCLRTNDFKVLRSELEKPESERSAGWDLNFDSKVDNADLSEALRHLCPDVVVPASIQQPNLTLSSPTLSPRKSLYSSADSSIKVSSIIRNTGKGNSGNFVVALKNKVDGKVLYQQTLDSLARNKRANFSYSFPDLGWAKEGSNSLILVVDPDNSISESNENDNSTELSLNVTIPKPPDLSITKVSLSPRKTTYNSSDTNIKVNVSFKNSGDIETGGYTSTLTKDSSLLAQQNLSNLKGKRTDSFSFALSDLSFVSNGQNRLQIILDSDNTVIESNEANNSATVSFNFSLPAPEQKQQSIPAPANQSASTTSSTSSSTSNSQKPTQTGLIKTSTKVGGGSTKPKPKPSSYIDSDIGAADIWGVFTKLLGGGM